MTFARKALPVLLLAFALFLPVVSFADVTSVASPGWHIIPDACKCTDSAPDFGCVLQVTQNLMNFGVYIAIIAMTLAIALAGFLWIFTPISAQQREMAKSTLTNALIGMVIVLSAWLIVDFVMKTLYNNNSSWGPWNQILKADAASECIQSHVASTQPASNGGGLTTGQPTTGGPTTGSAACGSGGTAISDSVIQVQSGDESGALSSFLSCMRGKTASGVGRISSISDCQIHGNCGTSNLPSRTWDQCLNGQCQHAADSCHYGGTTGQHKSYAVDFGDENNTNALLAAAKSCNSDARYFYEGDHLHISLGHASNAGCDMNMAPIPSNITACQ